MDGVRLDRLTKWLVDGPTSRRGLLRLTFGGGLAAVVFGPPMRFAIFGERSGRLLPHAQSSAAVTWRYSPPRESILPSARASDGQLPMVRRCVGGGLQLNSLLQANARAGVSGFAP